MNIRQTHDIRRDWVPDDGRVIGKVRMKGLAAPGYEDFGGKTEAIINTKQPLRLLKVGDFRELHRRNPES